MKHIKTYETLMKYSDPRVINHMFRPFAEKLKSLLETLKNIDNYKGSNVKMYYDDYTKDIRIIYRYKHTDLFNIRLLTYDRPTGLELSLVIKYHNYNSYNKVLYNIFDSILEKYELERCIYYHHMRDLKIDDPNNLSVLDNIYNDIKNDFDLYISTQKYNL